MVTISKKEASDVSPFEELRRSLAGLETLLARSKELLGQAEQERDALAGVLACVDHGADAYAQKLRRGLVACAGQAADARAVLSRTSDYATFLSNGAQALTHLSRIAACCEALGVRP
jgi:hypothetical protein